MVRRRAIAPTVGQGPPYPYMSTDPLIEPLGEDALLLRLAQRIDPAINARVHALAAAIDACRPPWLRECVPAYASLAVRIDPDALDGGLDAAARWLRSLAGEPFAGADDALPVAEIPVLYGGDAGPDLPAFAARAGLSAAQVVERHLAGDYRVAMLGFAPGFPYLLGLDPRLATPRLDTPRTQVPAGSVGIGGAQAGIYPRAGPGGWNLIGRTPLTLFDAARSPPNLLAPGQRLRFVRIDADTFTRLVAQRGPKAKALDTDQIRCKRIKACLALYPP